ncbi:alpha-mannosidase [Gelidibacter salicanalis]|uniref:Alpha-mannosidase n=1 Tax=Gelidibacter salicanalis TaxID=291193 RepID=A0A5C7AII5_9FLAO|nr:GH92 family glycosyl hydrolase [Gelidibacter salicanalis]TXE08388.1 alpha-mannosidase [Gelidibacter salicanalis]
MKKLKLTSLFYFIVILGVYAQTKKSPIDYIDPMIGTGFHGHTYPGATVPFGAVQLSPDTRRGNWDAASGYHYDDSTILGFSHTHLSGTGVTDFGDILFRPTTTEINLNNTGDIYKPATFSHKDEKASAGYYSVLLKDENIKAELTATTYAGVHRYTFPKDKQASIIIDLAHLLDDEFIYEAELQATSKNEIVGMRRTRGWVDNQYIYFVAEFSQPFESVDFINSKKRVPSSKKIMGNDLQAVLNFKGNKTIIVKVGLSIVSAENARENLENDVVNFDFDAVHKGARKIWSESISAISVRGGSEDELTNFYTAMYHAMVAPNIVNDVNGDYRRHDMSIGKLGKNEKKYSTLSIWDTFRAWNPMMTLIDTTLVNDIIKSFLDIYDVTDELPIWPLSAGETGTMIGYHSVSVIADAYLNGIKGFDAEKALEAMIISSEKNKKGADYYIKYGFIPSNIKKESVSCLLEFAYDDWTIAQMAKAMGKEDVFKTYIERSQNYVNVFDGATKFFRGKKMDGNWEKSFNPFEVGREYTEATAWQYRFFVPHDVNGMVQQFGGKDSFISSLDSLFTVDSKIDGTMSDITGLIGQYAHGNEPSHHMAFLYNYVGQPWKTQAMTRRILDEMYQPTPEGISGNEDCGQISAWYILTSLGLYAVSPGSTEFTLTTPLFEEATLKLANGNTLQILGNDTKNNIYIDKVELNGKEINQNFITYKQLMEGGELRFTLTSKPNMKRGTTPETSPYSLTTNSIVSIPFVDKDLNLFLDDINVAFGTATQGAQIRYTLDGSDPTKNSPMYEKPISLKQTTQIKAIGFKEGFSPSRTLSIKATKAELRPALNIQSLQNGTSYKYYEGVYKYVSDIEKSLLLDTGIMDEPNIENAKQADHFGYIFSGLINVPEDGVYTFQTRSDDGSVLFLHEEKIVDNDGSHSAIPAFGTIALKKGFHPYTLYYFEDYEGQHLSWSWITPSSTELVPIPASVLFIK